MSKRRVYTLIAILVGCFIIAAWLDNPPTRQQQVLEAYNICNSARLEPSGRSEQACGDVLDKYNLVFTCEQRNRKLDNVCYVYDEKEVRARYE